MGKALDIIRIEFYDGGYIQIIHFKGNIMKVSESLEVCYYMKRVMVIGCPGSGKSTFSKALHKKTSLPLFHLDLMNWNSDRSTVERNIFIERLYKTIQKDEWIIDGN